MFLRVLFLALTLAAPVFAQTLPDPQSDTLSDFADVLDATEEGRISRLLTETRAATGVQMVVVTMPGIASQGGAGQRGASRFRIGQSLLDLVLPFFEQTKDRLIQEISQKPGQDHEVQHLDGDEAGIDTEGVNK